MSTTYLSVSKQPSRTKLQNQLFLNMSRRVTRGMKVSENEKQKHSKAESKVKFSLFKTGQNENGTIKARLRSATDKAKENGNFTKDDK